MTVEELLLEGNKYIHKDQSKLILATILEYDFLELTFHLKDIIGNDKVLKFRECINNIKKGIPIQYALKNTNFYGLDFYVDSRVLIPRFETEELVYNTNNYINKYFQEDSKVLDLCAGSGCIGLTLKHLNNKLDLTLSDLSPYALEVCDINRKKFNLNVKLKESDLFTNIDEKFDVIISNPPYVSERDEIDSLVLNNEPSIALFANNDGLEFYERILMVCESYLNNKYLIAFEIGESQKDKVLLLIDKYLKNVKVITKKDMSKRDRMVFIFKNIIINE